MKFLAVAALLGAISAQEIFENESELASIQRVTVSRDMQRVTCPRLRPKIQYALDKAHTVVSATRVHPDTVGINDLEHAQNVLNHECSWDPRDYHFYCRPGQVTEIQQALSRAQ